MKHDNEIVSVSLTQNELLLLSNALLRAIADNNRAASLIIGIEDKKIIQQIIEANETLGILNAKICQSMS